MKRRTLSRILCVALCCTISVSTWAFGPTGHRIIATIAEPYLNDSTRVHIHEIIGDQTLGKASTWPDEMRGNPSKYWQKTAKPFHYVTVPPGKTYLQVGAPPQGDAYSALMDFRDILRNPRASLADKQLALRFTVHIIADLHQPLHVGNGKDLGGNRVKVRFMGKSSNLHRVWDSGLIRQREMSVERWANWLAEGVSQDDVDNWSGDNALVWIVESAALREQVYPTGQDIGWDYIHVQMPALQQRLRQAGVRTAGYLNGLW